MVLKALYLVQFDRGKRLKDDLSIDCHTEITVINGTIFHKSTKPLLIWFGQFGGWLPKRM